MKFLRRDSNRYSRLGKKRKVLQKWRRPTGRDNKMREKRRGYPAVVSVGYKKDSETRGKSEGKDIIKVNNLEELEKVRKGAKVVLGRAGKKLKLEMIKKAEEKGIHVHNLNTKKYAKKADKK